MDYNYLQERRKVPEDSGTISEEERGLLVKEGTPPEIKEQGLTENELRLSTI